MLCWPARPPAIKPLLRGLRTFADGRIWVLLSTPSERFTPQPTRTDAGPLLRWREPRRYDVFERDGAYVGQVTVPDDLHLSIAHADIVWGWSNDAAGKPTVVRYRIDWRN